MINIENSQIINYGDGQTVTVYQDDTDANKYYIVPKPRIALSTKGEPEFSLVEYKSNDPLGGTAISGVCTFQAELYVSNAVMTAVKSKLGEDIVVGNFDWESAKAIFTYEVNGLTLTQIAQGSLYGGNRVAIVVQLPSNEAVQAFINAFGPSGSQGGTFNLSYQLSTFAALPPATVTVTFDANTAYSYEKTVTQSKNIWGHVTDRAVEVHQYLQQSQAGKVIVSPGSRNLPPATLKRLTDWGNQTLLNDVDTSIQNTFDVIGANNADTFNCSMIPSFKNVYQEDQIIVWLINSMEALPAFSKQTWEKVFSIVENRFLEISFVIQNLGENDVESVTVTIDYETAKTGNTHHFTADNSGAWIYTTAANFIDGQFDPDFTYSYVVQYSNGDDPYTSPKIKSQKTSIFINIRDLKPLTVGFSANNVIFSKTSHPQDTKVERLEVEFYFVCDSSGMVTDVNFELTDKAPTFKLNSTTKLPSTNPYQFRTTYFLTDNTFIKTSWITSNAITQFLTSPFSDRQVSLFVIGSSLQTVALTANYTDEVNNITHNHQWQINPITQVPIPWELIIPVTTENMLISYSGQYISTEGKITIIQNNKINLPFISISDTQTVESVTFDASQIQWQEDKVTKVNLQLHRITKDGTITDVSGTLFSSKNATPYLWTFIYTNGTTPEYYWEAQYWHEDESLPTTTGEIKQSGETIVVLPRNIN